MGADRARRARRQARDSFAERRAIQVILAIFLGIGGLSLGILNFGRPFSSDRSNPPSTGVAHPSSPTSPIKGREKPPRRRTGAPANAREATTSLDETPDVPALRFLQHEGLTVGAEGIPRVASTASEVATVAGRETCRFAYATWEFSPNQTFRFISSCQGFGRLELLGAYELRGSRVYLSELAAGAARWTGVLRVEHPASMVTRLVSPDGAGRAHELQITQRITVVRGGLHGDDFVDGFKRRNRLRVPDGSNRPETSAPDAQGEGASKLEELLGG